jgi:hypothetical protein
MAMKWTGIGAALALAMLIASMGGAHAVGVGGICGPIRNGACDPGLFCEKKAGACHRIGGTGRCVRVPEFCPALWEPVCGCDGKSYPNDCERIRARIEKDHNGRCGE